MDELAPLALNSTPTAARPLMGPLCSQWKIACMPARPCGSYVCAAVRAFVGPTVSPPPNAICKSIAPP